MRRACREKRRRADPENGLQELDLFGQTFNETYPHLNATTKALYTRSIAYHHRALQQTLFGYLNRRPESPRTISQLRAGYKVPRGIIIPVGNDQMIYAVSLIATLKHVHRTELPIWVVYAGGDDLDPAKRSALRSIHPSVETVDILNFFDEEYVGIHGGGWAIKVFAILASPFQEVIIADADAVFVQNPEVMFDSPGYNETGTYFFRDREIFAGPGQVHDWWRSVMKGRVPSKQLASSRWWTDMASREEMESGVVVFDKRRLSVVYGLIFTGWLNSRAVREEVTYRNTYGALTRSRPLQLFPSRLADNGELVTGDKESFWMVSVSLPASFAVLNSSDDRNCRPLSCAGCRITSTRSTQASSVN